jgi:hypothetical protein
LDAVLEVGKIRLPPPLANRDLPRQAAFLSTVVNVEINPTSAHSLRANVGLRMSTLRCIEMYMHEGMIERKQWLVRAAEVKLL